MGTKITELMQSKPISLDDLRNKTVVVDAFNQLYMFLSSIRQPDGALLKDSKDQVTSHLNGLFYRFTKLMENDVRFIFVFDGKPPALKLQERKRRAELKNEAQLKYEKAAVQENIEDMKKYASRTSKLTKEMVDDAKALMEALGCPVVQAPSEGEAQAAFMVKKKDAYASLSQDADSLLFGCPLVVKNLTLSGRRKVPNKLSFDSITPELISLNDTLKSLDINQDQLIALSMFTGTDFNYGGIKGIGPKTALKLVKQYGNDFDKMFNENKWNEHFEFGWKEVFDTIKNMETTDDYDLKYREVNDEKVMKILCDEHEFSSDRVAKVLQTVHKKPKTQKGLGEYF